MKRWLALLRPITGILEVCNLFLSLAQRKKLYSLLSCVPMVASGKAERFGAKKEAKKRDSFILWRRERIKRHPP
jgi:hypothetical protein